MHADAGGDAHERAQYGGLVHGVAHEGPLHGHSSEQRLEREVPARLDGEPSLEQAGQELQQPGRMRLPVGDAGSRACIAVLSASLVPTTMVAGDQQLPGQPTCLEALVSTGHVLHGCRPLGS